MILSIIVIFLLASILTALLRCWNIPRGMYLSNTFKNGVKSDEGDYALVTGTRLANGGVLSEMQLFHETS